MHPKDGPLPLLPKRLPIQFENHFPETVTATFEKLIPTNIFRQLKKSGDYHQGSRNANFQINYIWKIIDPETETDIFLNKNISKYVFFPSVTFFGNSGARGSMRQISRL